MRFGFARGTATGPALILGFVLGVAFCSTSGYAVPSDYAFSRVPSRFQSMELTAGSRGLAELFLSRDTLPDGTVCNPAFLPALQENSLLARIFVGNDYTALSNADRFIFKPLSKGFLQELFQRQNVTSVEAHVRLVFSTRYFSGAFSPYRVQYVSEVHNPNFPVVSVHASIERSFVFSGGDPFGIYLS